MVNIKNVAKKINNQLINRGYGPKNYPNKFKYILNHCEFDEENFCEKVINSSTSNKANIKLASKYTIMDAKNFWKKKYFEDDEDIGYLHRWSWALNLILEKNNYKKSFTQKYIKVVINNWFAKYQNSSFDNKKIEWYPYNISERISNYVLLIELNILKKNNIFLKLLKKQMYFLTKNMEFYKNKKSNHSLNNARAIFLLSCITKNEIFKKFSLDLILFLCKEFIDKDGFFKFGSSHYQFIFTRWLIDIHNVGKKYNAKKINNLKSYLDKSLNACNFFIQIDNQNKKTIPLFGNISPDFTPEFLINNFNQFYKKIALSKKKIKKNNEWFKLENKYQSIYFRNPIINGFNFNHAHSDFFHFVNFFKGTQVFVDIGRQNYLKDNLKYALANAHNSICFENSGFFDNFIKKDFLTRIGLVELSKKKYLVKKSKNCIRFIVLFDDGSTIERKFQLKGKILVIENNFKKFRNKKKMQMLFYLDNKIKISKKNQQSLFLKSNLINSSLEIQSTNNDLKIEFDRSKKEKFKLNQCKSYGFGKKISCICIKSSGKKNYKITIKLEFLK